MDNKKILSPEFLRSVGLGLCFFITLHLLPAYYIIQAAMGFTMKAGSTFLGLGSHGLFYFFPPSQGFETMHDYLPWMFIPLMVLLAVDGGVLGYRAQGGRVYGCLIASLAYSITLAIVIVNRLQPRYAFSAADYKCVVAMVIVAVVSLIVGALLRRR